MEKKRGRGRPATGVATTSSERAAKRDRELKEAGGRILSNVRLSPEATQALGRLAEQSTERRAIEAALIGWDSVMGRSDNAEGDGLA